MLLVVFGDTTSVASHWFDCGPCVRRTGMVSMLLHQLSAPSTSISGYVMLYISGLLASELVCFWILTDKLRSGNSKSSSSSATTPPSVSVM